MPKVISKLPMHNDFLDTARLLSRYSDEFSFKWGRCTLKTLGVEFPLSNFPTAFLTDNYFKERNKYCFRGENGKVYVTIDDHVFHTPFPFGLYELQEVYEDECYREGVTQGTVLDVGAFIGDSAVYFAANGAKKVIAFEPVKMLFNLAVENVALNGYNGVIDVRNCAVGTSNGETTIMFDPKWPGMSSMLLPSEKGVKQIVRVVSLSEVIREIGTIDLLKLDCEGMEQKLIPSLQQEGTLGMVNKIIMEVHGSNKPLLQILESEGFATKTSDIDTSAGSSARALVFAFRQDRFGNS